MSGQPEGRWSPRALGVSGSLRATSKTRLVLGHTLKALSACGAQVQMLDLATVSLPLFSGYSYPEAEGEAVAGFRTAVASSDIVLLASPEYHGALSGSLKNALDHLPEESFRGKAVGLIGVAGGSVSPVATTAQLRAVVRALGGVASPCELLVSHAKRALDAQGAFTEPELSGHATKFARELVALSRQLNPISSPPELVNA